MGEWLDTERFLKSLKKFDIYYDNNIVSARTIRRKAKKSSSYFDLNSKFFYFNYEKGIGRGGKVLQIWSEPIDPADLEAFRNNASANTGVKAGVKDGDASDGYQRQGVENDGNTRNDPYHSKHCSSNLWIASPSDPIWGLKRLKGLEHSEKDKDSQEDRNHKEDNHSKDRAEDKNIKEDKSSREDKSRATQGFSTTQASKENIPPVSEGSTSKEKALTLTPFGKASPKAQEGAMLKARVIKEWEGARAKGVKGGDFIQSINHSRLYPFVLTPAKLYGWQRAYKSFGIDGLIESRGKHREDIGIIKSNQVIADLVIRLILASKARFNLALIYESVHFNLWQMGLFEDLEGFLKKQSCLFSYNTLKRFIDSYLSDHREVKLLVEGGESKLDSHMMPSIGDASWAVGSINEIVEIDASPIDVILDVPRLCRDYNYDIDTMEVIQARYSLISLIDVYSRVCVFHICESENSLGVARAIAKYILTYGKPKIIKGDNGRAFKSKYIQEVCLKLGIDFLHTAPYSGWLKPYVESNFKKLQHKAVELMAGYIGHNVAQRKAIEEFNSRKERRLLKGEKTHLKGLLTLQEFEEQVEIYNKIALNKFNSKLGDSPMNIYNKKSHEAVGMSECELTFYLSHLEERRVLKGGVMLNNTLYQLPELYEHSRVFAGVNINNVAQAFVYDKNKKFLDIALAQGTFKDTLEVAKQSRKVFERAKKKVKEEMVKARAQVESESPMLYQEVASKLTAAKKPKVATINAELEHSKLKAQAKMASGSEEFLSLIANKEEKEKIEKSKQKVAKRPTWEEIAGVSKT
ncbi:DDE-type integrase/transposase/recombinase [Helicobacter sp. 12S02634-8]|uniref:DDE-type integrase/transposase/recombinase n=1 Tax=Helicobacter sp. 12S02634-8 TaxID=1476199 RepID=UPI00117BB676|nr:DDE-type integrase/transposase/recombinase [Helicobacter sp. 12S02634-8]